MVEAATEFRKSGFSDEDAANLALVATMYQNVADESISAADSAGFIISQMKAFNIEAENATHIIDAVNEVSNKYAVSSSDLANNLGKVSSALAVGGVSFEETLGMMTAITEITRNSSTAARGLVSVQSRFNQIIDETSSTGQKLIAFYDKHGIAIKDQDGQLRNLYDVLKDTAGIWDTLDENEQKYFLNIQAGANQTRNLAALMENFGVAVSATATAMDSAGSAAQENAGVMESLQKKIDNLRAAWENFSNNTITKDFIGSILDAGTQLLTFANTDLGQATVKALLFGTTIGSATGFIGTFVSSIGKAITNVGKLIPMFKAGEIGVAGLFGAFAKPTLTLFALGVAGVVAALVLLNEALGDGESAFDRYMSKAEEAVQEQEAYKNKLDDAKAKLEELNKVPYADRTAEQEAEIRYLEDLIAKYEELIAVKGQEAATNFAKAAQEMEEQGVSTGTVGVEVSRGVKGYKGTYTDKSIVSDEQFAQLQSLAGEYSNVDDAINAYVETLGIKRYNEDLSQKTQEQLIAELRSYGVSIDGITESVQESSDRMLDYSNALVATKTPTQDQIDEAQRLLEANAGLAESYRGILENGGALSNEQRGWLASYTALEQTVAQSEQAVNRYKVALETLKQFSDGGPFGSTEQSLTQLSQSLINNSALGIQSIDDLRVALQQLADAGHIDFSNIEGGIDGFIQRLMEVEGFDFSPKTVDIIADDSDAIQGIDEVIDAASEVPPQIISEISTTSDADAMVASLDNLNAAIDRLQGKSVDVKIDANTNPAISALDGLKSQIEGTATNVDINAVGNDMALPMLNQIKTMADSIPREITVKVDANITSALQKLNKIKNYKIPNKNFSVNCIDEASGTLIYIIKLLRQIEDKEIKITVTYVTANNPPPGLATGTNYFAGGPAIINDGSPVNGSAGELVVSDGVGRIYNGGEETIANLPQGAEVYTAAETQELLKDQGLTVDDVAGMGIMSFASGTNKHEHIDRRFDPNWSGVVDLSGSGETLKKNFDEWLKEMRHNLNMGLITEAQYYRDLEIMNEKYLSNMTDYKDEYWQHEEEIYKYENEALEKQIQLEEKLSQLAKAKTQKVLTYTGGRFQYLQNIEAIAAAQREVDELTGQYANGTMSARGGLSLVGEKGPELRVLKNGDGIIPADATKNLLSLSRFSAKDIISAAKSNITQYAFSISNISLPNVQSPEDFIDGLRNMAYQYSFTRT